MGGIITEVIPSFETILGPQSKPAILAGPTETQNRFHRVFVQFIQALATQEHPLVIFLDDLQWADRPSLHILQLLCSNPETRYLLILGAYRDNEVDRAHMLTMTLDELKKTGNTFQTLVLPPLSQDSVNELLAHTLHTTIQNIQSLSELCYAKTHGNPFFLNQLLLSLYQEGSIYLDESHEHWSWDTSQIQRKGVTDNVVDLMANKIHNLQNTTRHVLCLAACIGFRFDLKTLAFVKAKQTLPQIYGKL